MGLGRIRGRAAHPVEPADRRVEEEESLVARVRIGARQVVC